MSLCDTCKQPGACCKDMVLSGTLWPGGTVWEENWREQALEMQAKYLPGTPFVPLRFVRSEGERRDPAAAAEYGVVHWSCPRLGEDGRCSDYENRPQLCRYYQPGSDQLCVMYVPPEQEAA